MADQAIRVQELCKRYTIGVAQPSYYTLRDRLSLGVRRIFRRNGKASLENNSFWALKDVSFEIKPGEVVGVIGRNGAGKSTLLKILSRITKPTSGYAEIRGRVGSLLEVGTGFHQELSGRENIYLNGAILGMKKEEVERSFDEIVAFAEVEKFIDTPVKHYSSGMYLRLAFAVAAHLEPEILIVDEVLAVGDAAFQNKCLGKMEDVARQGRTVLLVSHNMLAIQSLCSKAILLENAGLAAQGAVDDVVKEYLGALEKLYKKPISQRSDRRGGEDFLFIEVQFLNADSMRPLNVIISGQPVVVRIQYENTTMRNLTDVGIGIAFLTKNGIQLAACRSKAVGVALDVPPGKGYTDCLLPRWPLKQSVYTYDLYAEKNGTLLDWLKDAGSIDVDTGDYYGSGYLPSPGQPGVLIDYSWSPRPAQDGGGARKP